MITINLRPGVKRSRGGRSFAAFGGLGDLGSKIKNPLAILSIGAWVVVLGFLAWTWFSTGSQLKSLEPELVSTQAEHQRYRDFLMEKQREESVRDSILSQIQTIQNVDGERYIWPHVLDEVSRALPAFTWLTDISTSTPPAQTFDSLGGPVAPVPVQFEISGRTVDIQGFTRFLRQLEASPWITGVVAVSAETVVEGDRAVNAFVIRGTHSHADSSFVRVVPVRESVVR